MQSFTVCLLLLLTFTVHAEVVQNFKNKCKEYFYRGSEPQVQSPRDYTHICQRFDNEYRFATLYDTANRIPVYSAYKYEYKGGTCPREDYWFIEPQLVNQNWENHMMWEGDLAKKHPNVSLGHKQATDSDYSEFENTTGYNRGHLNPNLHHSGSGCSATFTLTNVVPQNRDLNGGSWNKYETNLMDTLGNCKTAYVLVGAVPSKDHWVKKGNKKRVNIPDYLWHAYCCVDNKGKPYKSGAAAVKNIKTEVVECSLDSLRDFFKKVGSKIHQPFSHNCNAPISIGDRDCASIVP